MACALAVSVLVPGAATAKPKVTTCGMYHHSYYDTWWQYRLATVKPDTFDYSCAATSTVTIGKWKKYRKNKAVAKGKVTWVKNWDDYPELKQKTTKGVRFTFTRPKRMKQDRKVKVFTRLHIKHRKLKNRLKGRYTLQAAGPHEGGSCDLGFSRHTTHNTSLCPAIKVP